MSQKDAFGGNGQSPENDNDEYQKFEVSNEREAFNNVSASLKCGNKQNKKDSGTLQPLHQRSNGVRKPPGRFQDLPNVSRDDPVTYDKAKESAKNENWKHSMKNELDS